ncbi:MAG: ClpX C4-type zinc finger protein [Acidobacteriota bacterium]
MELAERCRTGRTPSGPLVPAKEGAGARCSFCGKRKTSDRALLTGPANICGECLSVCQQILIDSVA